MKRMLSILLGGLVALALLSNVPAAPLEQSAVNQDIYVTPAAGPWMIMAAWYKGEDGPQLAREFALELQRVYKVNTYVFNHGAKERQEQQSEIEKMKAQLNLPPGARIRRVRVEEQWTVLIGGPKDGYKDMEAANKAMKDLKNRAYADIKSDRVPPNWTKYFSVVWTAPLEKGETVTKDRIGPKDAKWDHPLLHAMVVRNPSIPQEVKRDNKPDPFLKELNSGESFSLLKCKKHWTLAVKELRGTSEIRTANQSASVLEKLGMGKSGDSLNASAHMAHNLAMVLDASKNKFFPGQDVYVLHTRWSSVVTVGGFDRRDDPDLLRLQKLLADVAFGGGLADVNEPREDGKMHLFRFPMPMEVPQL